MRLGTLSMFSSQPYDARDHLADGALRVQVPKISGFRSLPLDSENLRMVVGT